MARVEDYPVRLEVVYPEGGNRFMILARWFLAIPHYLVLFLLYIPIGIASTLPWVAFWHAVGFGEGLDLQLFPVWALILLFTARFPEWLFIYLTGVMRYGYNVGAYVLFHDEYPPFNWDEDEYGPVRFEVIRQERYSRWLPFVKGILAFPHLVIVGVLMLCACFVYLYIWFAVLLTGRYPRGAFEFCIEATRWSARVTAYANLLVDPYPPFTGKARSPSPAQGLEDEQSAAWRAL